MTKGQSNQSAYFMRSAKRIAREAKESFDKGEYDRVVRKTQESVELYLKSHLLLEGVEAVKTHDLVLLTANLKKKIKVDRETLDFLTEERIPAFYGAADFVPDETYEEDDGKRCLKALQALGLF